MSILHCISEKIELSESKQHPTIIDGIDMFIARCMAQIEKNKERVIAIHVSEEDLNVLKNSKRYLEIPDVSIFGVRIYTDIEKALVFVGENGSTYTFHEVNIPILDLLT